MSVVFEPRSFIHEGGYPPMTDPDHEHSGDAVARFGDADDSALYPSPLLPDDRSILTDRGDRSLMPDSSSSTGRLSLAASTALVPPIPTMEPTLPEVTAASTLVDGDTSPPEGTSPAFARIKPIPKPEREVSKHSDGRFYCSWEGCTESAQGFARRCEWSKHMDKHERPYRCDHQGCEKLAGFTYSGGLLRHEREVHGRHGGPKNTVNCPHVNCKRHTGKGFSRQENLNEHLRRVHTEGVASPGEDQLPTSDNDSEKAGTKRKMSARESSAQIDDLPDLREEVKRLRTENAQLRLDVDTHQKQNLTMMAQITELQDALRLNNASMSPPVPSGL